ncbi:hypothetical protein [Sellimonas intestinalis]|uniref:hypothetical protein n=1 Tax=Sellimonas intestinalis TaxID=1653434 RepID=UPI00399C0983
MVKYSLAGPVKSCIQYEERGVWAYEMTCIGAAHEVTGSYHLLEAAASTILIDCGMEQGPDLYENQELSVWQPGGRLILSC